MPASLDSPVNGNHLLPRCDLRGPARLHQIFVKEVDSFKIMGSKVWLYILSSNDRHYYVGITCRLVKRLKEHLKGRGANCTSVWYYDVIEAVYCIGDKDTDDDERYHHHREDLALEEMLTLKMMKLKGYGCFTKT
jgi:hypothetical protein